MKVIEPVVRDFGINVDKMIESEENTGVIEWSGTVYCVDDDDNEVKMGYWGAVVFPTWYDDHILVERADVVSSDLLAAVNALVTQEEEMTRHLLFISMIQFSRPYRGFGGGKTVLRDIIRLIGYGCDTAIMEPCPAVDTYPGGTRCDAGRAKLYAYWSQCEGALPIGPRHLLFDLRTRNNWLTNEQS